LEVNDKTYYLFGPDSTVAKFIVRGYSTGSITYDKFGENPVAKNVLFCTAKKEYIDCTNLTEFTLEEARAHWSYLMSRGWYGIDTPQMDCASQPRRQTLKYALEA
jgi:hypothetical protein